MTAMGDYIVCLQLGKQPCLLSMPSVVDLSVTVPDLVKRLTLYRESGADVREADLFLALTRLDVKTKTPEAVKALQESDVPVMFQSGRKMPVTAGKAVVRYLDDPIRETAMDVERYGWWNREVFVMPESLNRFPDRLKTYSSGVREIILHENMDKLILNGYNELPVTVHDPNEGRFLELTLHGNFVLPHGLPRLNSLRVSHITDFDLTPIADTFACLSFFEQIRMGAGTGGCED